MLTRNPPSGSVVTVQSFPSSNAVPDSGEAITVNWKDGPVQHLKQTAPCVVTMVGLPAGESVPKLTLFITIGAGAPFPGPLLILGARTPGGQGLSLSTTPTAVDEVEITWDGFVAYAHVVGHDYG
jgi:hypothetical protein